jgi:hypothetical protein
VLIAPQPAVIEASALDGELPEMPAPFALVAPPPAPADDSGGVFGFEEQAAHTAATARQQARKHDVENVRFIGCLDRSLDDAAVLTYCIRTRTRS